MMLAAGVGSPAAAGVLFLGAIALLITSVMLNRRAIPPVPDLARSSVGRLSRDRVVKIDFSVDGRLAQFRWNRLTGRAELRFDTERVTLQSPWHFSAHFSLETERVWRHIIGQQLVEIEKQRPRTFAGFRPNLFIVRVDGTTVPI
ncbi:hypothetical protein [Nocardioides ungokensis]|uniref:hypothetical protein n=1 Tax=Nocardioides ungokensis TaxID=1643322 RepID=UPI0015DF0F74|nr:hypothetical protein [Nocardioides ungokensis]